MKLLMMESPAITSLFVSNGLCSSSVCAHTCAVFNVRDPVSCLVSFKLIFTILDSGWRDERF